MSREEVLCLLCSLARTIRNDSLTLVKSSENRNIRRFHYISHLPCFWSSCASMVFGFVWMSWYCKAGLLVLLSIFIAC